MGQRESSSNEDPIKNNISTSGANLKNNASTLQNANNQNSNSKANISTLRKGSERLNPTIGLQKLPPAGPQSKLGSQIGINPNLNQKNMAVISERNVANTGHNHNNSYMGANQQNKN